MKVLRYWVCIVLASLLISPVLAEIENDTASELAAAVIPPRDRIDLAGRLLGVTEIAPPPAAPPQWQVGDVKTFWVTNEYEDQLFQVEASLRAIGEHIYLWVEAGVDVDTATLDELAQLFDDDIYEPMHHLWGSENSPGIDGDPRVYGLFAYGQGPGVAAYFASEHIYPVEAVSTSNEHEMFSFNLDTLGTDFPAEPVAGVVAHEFQHMIQEHLDTNESIWLNEGFSKFSEIYVGFPFSTIATAATFLGLPETQLNHWPEDGTTIPHYGAGLLFVTYFYDRFGEDAVRALAQHPANGLEGIDAVLAERGETDADSLFADWVLANYVQDTTVGAGIYGYHSLPALSPPKLRMISGELPYTHADEANQYSTDYYVFNNLTGGTTLEINLTTPEMVQLVPATPTSGERMWYSNKADNSDTTITRRFDLSGVDSATLAYNVWYHIENLWDYGYVMVSTDDGATWDILETPEMTWENPHNNAYGPGYTGLSDGWVAESISLDAYAGQDILLRFEMITDDATTQPGMLIDDVRIPEIDYASDFEADSGGWEARGWIWTDNTLPQQVWVQAVQESGTDRQFDRWLVPADAPIALELVEGVDQVMLAISPFAPLTTVPMPYTLALDVTVR